MPGYAGAANDLCKKTIASNANSSSFFIFQKKLIV
jgi:hypothetical protein